MSSLCHPNAIVPQHVQKKKAPTTLLTLTQTNSVICSIYSLVIVNNSIGRPVKFYSTQLVPLVTRELDTLGTVSVTTAA